MTRHKGEPVRPDGGVPSGACTHRRHLGWRLLRKAPWPLIAIEVHVYVLLAVGAGSAIWMSCRAADSGDEPAGTEVAWRPAKSVSLDAGGIPDLLAEIIDRKSVAVIPGDLEGPVNPDAEYVPMGQSGHPGEITDEADPAKDPGVFNPDPEWLASLPSGATGGTSVGVGSLGHRGVGTPSAFASRDAGVGGGGASTFTSRAAGHSGRGGGGLGQGGGGGRGGGHGGGGVASAFGAPGATTWKPSRLTPNTSRLRVGDSEELPLDAFEATVHVDGARARVVLDCLYRNDRRRQLEGMFELRLPAEASPFWFAFGETAGVAPPPPTAPLSSDVATAIAPRAPAGADVQAMFLGASTATASASTPDGIRASRSAAWTAPKEARMVPSAKAARAYAETSRRRVDPALMEWSGAGVFSARVFPLAAGRTHRIVVAYDMDLTRIGDDMELRLDLPEGVAQRSVTVSVATTGSVFMTPWTTPASVDDRAVYSFRNPRDSQVHLRVAHPGTTLLVGDDAAAGSCFATTFTPALPETSAAAVSPAAVFLLDTSLSSNPERFPVWLKLLREVLERNRGSLDEFAVLTFDVHTRWWRNGFVPNTRENVDAVIAYAEGLALEGATDLRAALAEGAEPAWDRGPSRAAKVDLFLLSDGAATWGDTDVASLDAALAKSRRGTLFAYQTGLTGTDGATLAHIARETGGALFSVAGESEIEAAATAHRQRGFRVRGISVAGGSDLLIAGRPTTVYPGQSLRVAGRGAPEAGVPIVLTLEQNGREMQVATTPVGVLRSELASRAYGQIAVGQIEDLGDVAESPAKAYATHYRVVGSTCSLLMLESEADYVRFDIRPAADAARVRAEPASAFVARTVAARLREGADPRAGIVSWLRWMETTPGVTLRAPIDLLVAIGGMPARSFDVDASPLRCAPRRRADVPRALARELAEHDLSYDVVTEDAARVLAKSGPADALRVLSSLVEANPGDVDLARDVGFSALEWGFPGQAVHLFRRVARARPYEPETYRALGDALARSGNADLAIVYDEVAFSGSWDGRFGAFRRIAAMDYLRLLRRIERGEIATSIPAYASARRVVLEQQFSQHVAQQAAGLVVVITWNTDRTDVDLHVTDPRGEECFYSHPVTAAGGTITQDVTQGFGPEMFVAADPVPGDYAVRVHYFASDANRASLRSKVLATVYERWGTPQEKVTRKAVVLRVGEQVADVATVRVGE